jgi:hypothetical protein
MIDIPNATIGRAEDDAPDPVAIAATIDRADLKATTKSLIDETLARQEALDAAQDEESRLWFATQVLDILAEHSDAVTVDLVDWEDEVEEGMPFDVALGSVLDADGDEIDGRNDGGIEIRHHWVLDELRVDPQAADGDKYHPGHRISVVKAVTWLRDTVAEHA